MVDGGVELSITIFRTNCTPDERGTGTVVVTNRICMGGRGISGTNARVGSSSILRIHKGALGCIDHNKLGLRGTVRYFPVSLSNGVYVSINTSANNFASYVLVGNTIGICSVSINCNRLT